MEKELVYRTKRIILTVLILILFTLVREETKQNYENVSNSLLNSLEITQITNKEKEIITKNENSYVIKIKNPNKKQKTVTFEIEKENNKNEINTKYVKYKIIKENKELVTNNIENNILYKDVLNENETATYEIIFWIDENIDDKNKKFNAQLKII